MMGNRKGVAMQLKQLCPFLVINHCVAHRLALACKDARKEIIFYDQAEEMMKRIYKYFKNSSTRKNNLNLYQKLLNIPCINILKLHDIRWLAWYDAVKNVCESLPALLILFKESESEVGQRLYNDL